MMRDSDIILRPHMRVDPHTGRHAAKEGGQREREKGKRRREKVLGQFLLIFFCPTKSGSNSRLGNFSLNIYIVQINVSHCLLPLVHTECKGEI